jgi:hypothetical protein
MKKANVFLSNLLLLATAACDYSATSEASTIEGDAIQTALKDDRVSMATDTTVPPTETAIRVFLDWANGFRS